jgi:membrane associated rhomboid family serine protease
LKATLLLILSIIVAYFAEVAFLPTNFPSYLGFSTEGLLHGEVWTLVTALYVHEGLIHLFGNMLFLFIFGAALEKEVGGARMVGLFFFGGILTFLIGIPFYKPDVILVGASAAIFTLAGAIMLIHPTRLTIIILPVGLVAILFFLLNLYDVSVGAGGNVAYVSHIIGFLLGIPFGASWSKHPWRNLGITLVMLVLFVATVLLIAVILFRYSLKI